MVILITFPCWFRTVFQCTLVQCNVSPGCQPVEQLTTFSVWLSACLSVLFNKVLLIIISMILPGSAFFPHYLGWIKNIYCSLSGVYRSLYFCLYWAFIWLASLTLILNESPALSRPNPFFLSWFWYCLAKYQRTEITTWICHFLSTVIHNNRDRQGLAYLNARLFGQK